MVHKPFYFLQGKNEKSLSQSRKMRIGGHNEMKHDWGQKSWWGEGLDVERPMTPKSGSHSGLPLPNVFKLRRRGTFNSFLA